MSAEEFLKIYWQARTMYNALKAQSKIAARIGADDCVSYELMLEKMQACREQGKEVRDVINAIPDDLTRQLLTLRYINGLSWQQLQKEIGYSKTVCFDVHRKGLKDVDAIRNRHCPGP